MDYTNQEYCDMFLIYGASNQNAHEAARRYVEQFPNRRAPRPSVFLNLINRARTSGSFEPIRRNVVGRHFYVRNVHNEEAVLSAIEEDSSTSIRQISRILEMTKSTVHNILKENQLHAYHYTKVQHLMYYAGILDNTIISPFELPPRVNGKNDLTILLENVPLHLRRNTIFQHDGAPTHTFRNVCQFLNTIYPNRWIRRNGPQ
ncbi:hypothetical protein ALC57_07556 [Trachymyrmex cornetzi]|uniref:DUF4817 domain-containing protein n=1 Tax=Trachymyrmex cornetzi TaxID=471704 RepID=A0A151J7U6_9HYME|nr:hypothetical protein ALC57_07556 [Trachymyrmex cornetzi]